MVNTAWRNRIIETRTVGAAELRANESNWRRHPQAQANAIRGLLNEVGIVAPLIAYHSQRANGALTLIDGHMRQETGGTWPVTVLDVSDEEADLILASFDPITGLAEMDSAALATLLARVEMTPIEDAGLAGLLESLAAESAPEPVKSDVDAEPQVDRAEELMAQWQTAPGQIWQIGPHFAICGDCRQPETWQRLLAAAGVDKVNGAFTSPPYAEQRKEQYGGTPADKYVDWWEAVQANVKANLASDGSFFVNIKDNSEDYVRTVYVHELTIAMAKRWGWVYLDEFCWERVGTPGDPNMMGKFKNQWEPIFWYGLAKRPKFRPEAVRHESDGAILDDNYQPGLERSQGTGKSVVGQRKVGKGLAYPGNRVRANIGEALGHAAAFPVALPDFFVRAYSDPGDVWCDPFLGSGTTIVAAHQNGRIGLGIEMLPKYMGVILERLQTVTGQTPTLLSAP